MELAELLPPLLGEVRVTGRTLGSAVAGPFAQAYQLAAGLLVHPGREDLAAEKATTEHITVWGGLVLWAMAAAVQGARVDAAAEYLRFAKAGAIQLGERDRHDYQTNFGPTTSSFVLRKVFERDGAAIVPMGWEALEDEETHFVAKPSRA